MIRKIIVILVISKFKRFYAEVKKKSYSKKIKFEIRNFTY